jgi:hypothetical protein
MISVGIMIRDAAVLVTIRRCRYSYQIITLIFVSDIELLAAGIRPSLLGPRRPPGPGRSALRPRGQAARPDHLGRMCET